MSAPCKFTYVHAFKALRNSLTDPPTGNGIFDFIHRRSASPTKTKGETGYKIAPSQTKTQSLPIRDKKKLTPRKGGLFASMDLNASHPNSAGEMMEDMFRAGAGNAMDFDNDFTVPDEDDLLTRELRAAASGDAWPRIDPALLLEDAAHAARNSGDGENIEVVGVMAGVHDGEEGDVEDNASSTSTKAKTKAERGGRKKKATFTTNPASNHKAAMANTKTKLQKPTPAPAFPSRASARIAKTQPTATRARPLTKSAGNAKAAQLQARNCSPMTARAAALQDKAGARLTTRTRAKTLRSEAGGRSVRLRNWRGEIIGDECVVVVEEGETEEGEDVRY
jgi:hypothetical protein